MLRSIHAYRVAAGYALSLSTVMAGACAQPADPPTTEPSRVDVPAPVSAQAVPTPTPATSTQPASSADAIKAVLTAADPSAAINAYGQAVGAGADLAELQRAFVRRMVEFQIPEMAEAQARDLVSRDPAAGLAQAVVAYNAAKKSQTDEALARIASAVRLSPDDPFVQRTAGQIIAWFDTKADRTLIPDETRAAIEEARTIIANRSAYKDAYTKAREAYMAADAQTGESDAAGAAAAVTSTIPITPATPAVTNIYNTYTTYEPAPVVYDTAPAYSYGTVYGGVVYDPWYPSAWCAPAVGWWTGFSTAILISDNDCDDDYHHGGGHHHGHGHGNGHGGHDGGGRGDWSRGGGGGGGGGGGALVPPAGRPSRQGAMPAASVPPMTGSSAQSRSPLQPAPVNSDLQSAIRATPGAAGKLTRQYQQQAARAGTSNSGPMLTPSAVPVATPSGAAMPSTRGAAMPTPRGAAMPTPTPVSRPASAPTPSAPRLSKEARSSAPAMPSRSGPSASSAPRAVSSAPAPRASAPAPRAAAPAPRASAPAPRAAASASRSSAPAMGKASRSSSGGAGGGGGMSKGRR